MYCCRRSSSNHLPGYAALDCTVAPVRKSLSPIYLGGFSITPYPMSFNSANNVSKDTYSDKAILGLELLGSLQSVVDKSEASGLATTELCLVTEAEDNILFGLVHLGELLTKFILGDIGTAGMNYIDDHLLALKQAVGKELSSPDRDRSVGLGKGEKV